MDSVLGGSTFLSIFGDAHSSEPMPVEQPMRHTRESRTASLMSPLMREGDVELAGDNVDPFLAYANGDP